MKSVTICEETDGPKWHNVTGPGVSPLFMPMKLPEAFAAVSKSWRCDFSKSQEEMKKSNLKDFIGSDLSEEQFNKLVEYCRFETIYILFGLIELLIFSMYPVFGNLLFLA